MTLIDSVFIPNQDTGAKRQNSSSKLNTPGNELEHTRKNDIYESSTSKNVGGTSSLAIVSEEVEKKHTKKLQPVKNGKRFQNRVGVNSSEKIYLHQVLSLIEMENDHGSKKYNAPTIGIIEKVGQNQQTEEENISGPKPPPMPVSFTISLFIILSILWIIVNAIINTYEETNTKEKFALIVIEHVTRVARHILPIYWLTKTSEIRAYAIRKISNWIMNNHSIEFSEKVRNYISKI